MNPAVMNVFSIDLEEWFCVYNLSEVIPYAQWDQCESRVETSTLAILDLLAKHRVQGTFFVLGWVAERHPDLIREVERRGHEIASHGYSHRLITHLSRDEFRADLERSLEVLTPLATAPIRGFRAPSFSVTRKSWWALDILRECGIHYDSSMFPVGFHPDYGVPDAPLGAHRLAEGVLELPMSVAEVAGTRVPCCGGGYFRQSPYPLTRYLMERCHRQGRSVNFYLHPWEVDPGQPQMPLPLVKRLRHYNNLAKTMPRLKRLLSDFQFTSVRALYHSELASSAPGKHAIETEPRA